MGKYFLGSVGKAEAFKRDANGNLTLAFVSKTLTDSGINISTTKDDIRAGEGAPIQFSFYHDPSVEITLTDVLWKKEYLTAQLGANFNQGVDGQIDYITETLAIASNKLTLGKTIKEMPVACADGKQYIAWYTLKGQDDWKSYTASEPFTEIDITAADGTEYCVRYLAEESHAKTAEITSTIIPEELFLIITAPIFSGDACAASRGRAAGHITFEVPRFQLNGAQEFAMNMSQNQTMSLAGVALAGPSEDCDTSAGKLLRIIEVITAENWYDDVEQLVVDEDCLVAGEKPVVYGVLKDGTVIRCPNTGLVYKEGAAATYSVMTNAYVFPADTTVKININNGEGEGYLPTDDTVVIPEA